MKDGAGGWWRAKRLVGPRYSSLKSILVILETILKLSNRRQMARLGVQDEELLPCGLAQVKDLAFVTEFILNRSSWCCSRYFRAWNLCLWHYICTGIPELLFSRCLMENSIQIGRSPTAWCPQRLRATVRHEYIDGGFILDERWPLSCQSSLKMCSKYHERVASRSSPQPWPHAKVN